MILWPVGMALVVAWLVFHDPAFDYRLVVVGAVIPFLVDLPTGRLAVGHTLLLPVAVLTLVMLATRRRRAYRRHAIAIPIGMMLGLVASGMWTRPAVLWWPFFGVHFERHNLVPPVVVVFGGEIAGAVAIGWFVTRFRLHDREHLRTWLRTGRLGASSAGGRS